MLKPSNAINYSIYGILLAVLLNLPFIYPDWTNYTYRASVFDEIEIGMPSAVVTEKLRQSQIWCGIADRSSTQKECYFSDLGRDYLVRLNPSGDFVMEKSVNLRIHKGIQGWFSK